MGLSALGLTLVACGGGGGGGGAASTSTPSPSPSPSNRAPTVDAGENYTAGIVIGETVSVEGMGADPDGDTLIYTWSIFAQPGNGDGKIVEAEGVKAEFGATIPGEYILQLTADDGKGG